ncbi:MAG: non-heme iron oxygenase ferredoxin subunit [Thiobacillus sp.]|nr:non-heme iron oxygenase ferredoxin subunit [Thiobacillus sp.]
MMAWVSVAGAHELAPTQMKRVEAAGKRLLLANAEGKYYCVDEMCTHEDYSLWFGCIKGRSIKCSLHGSYFDLENGKPLNDPADCPLATYPTKVEDGQVWVDVA